MIVSVVEERVVTEKRLMLVEEVRIKRVRSLRTEPHAVELMREELIVERRDAEGGEWRVVEPEGGPESAADHSTDAAENTGNPAGGRPANP